MTDYRHCDGPDCEAKLDLSMSGMGLIGERMWVTLTRMNDFGDLHFHSDMCLKAWSLKNLKVLREGQEK